MRRKERDRTNKTFMEQVLTTAAEICLAFNTGSAPYALFFNFVFLDGTIYVHCALEGRKLDLLRQDARVGFTAAVDVRVVPEKATTHYRSVCGSGRASVVEDVHCKQRVLGALAERYGAHCPRPTPEPMLARTCLIRIDIEEMTGKGNVE